MERTMKDSPFEGQDAEAMTASLKRILELELAGVVRYLRYSFMVFGHSRSPISAWLRAQADESRDHAVHVGEHINSMGGHPSLKIGALLETHKHSISDILAEIRKMMRAPGSI
jgi:bacterioferritin